MENHTTLIEIAAGGPVLVAIGRARALVAPL